MTNMESPKTDRYVTYKDIDCEGNSKKWLSSILCG